MHRVHLRSQFWILWWLAQIIAHSFFLAGTFSKEVIKAHRKRRFHPQCLKVPADNWPMSLKTACAFNRVQHSDR